MKKKMVGIFIVTLLLIATGITVAGTLNQENNKKYYKNGVGASSWGWYNPTGAWKRYDNELFYTMSPAGLGRYSMVCEGKSLDPKWYGMFPTAVDLSTMYGEMVVSGKNTYDFTLIDYAIDENYEVVYFRLWNGVSEQTSKDTATSSFIASIYGPDQDPFGDEEPEYGCWGPWEFQYYRIPVVATCES